MRPERHDTRTPRRSRRSTVAATLCGAVIAGLAWIAAPADAAPLATGNAKTACIYTHNSIREMNAIGRRIGMPFRCGAVYNNVGTWDAWTKPWFISHNDPDLNWAGWVRRAPDRRKLVIGQSMIPTEGMPADWRRRGARGQYDGRIRLLARNLVKAGLGRSVIRLGFEANGDWNADHVGHSDRDFAQWRRYWARFARVMNRVPGARFTFDWNLNAAYRDIPLRKIYPGDRVVDVIGIDVYDSSGRTLPAAASPRRWPAIARQPGGVREIVAFARSRRKPISIPEWGLVGRADNGGGDNARFVAAIAALVRTNQVAYQAYFNNDQLADCLEIQKQRRAFAVYRRSFGAPSARKAAQGLRTARRS